MNRTLLGVLGGLMLVAAAIFWWQGRAETQVGEAPPSTPFTGGIAAPVDLPIGDPGGTKGAAPPEATEATREQRRYNRLDRDRDNRITRNEMLAPRAAAFRKLDVNGDNLLTFEEWAVHTSNRFKAADTNGDGWLSREELAASRPKPKLKPKSDCVCPPTKQAATSKRQAKPAPQIREVDDSADEDEGEPFA